MKQSPKNTNMTFKKCAGLAFFEQTVGSRPYIYIYIYILVENISE